MPTGPNEKSIFLTFDKCHRYQTRLPFLVLSPLIRAWWIAVTFDESTSLSLLTSGKLFFAVNKSKTRDKRDRVYKLKFCLFLFLNSVCPYVITSIIQIWSLQIIPETCQTPHHWKEDDISDDKDNTKNKDNDKDTHKDTHKYNL